MNNIYLVIMSYCDWKDATRAFQNHKESKTREAAVEAVVTLKVT